MGLTGYLLAELENLTRADLSASNAADAGNDFAQVFLDLFLNRGS